MFPKSFIWSFTSTGIVTGLIVAILFIITGCHLIDPNQVILDKDGKVVYVPDGNPSGMIQLPDIGNPTGNYLFASTVAALYGALGYWVRKVKMNGTQENVRLQERITRLETQRLAMPITTTTPVMTPEQIMEQLVKLLPKNE